MHRGGRKEGREASTIASRLIPDGEKRLESMRRRFDDCTLLQIGGRGKSGLAPLVVRECKRGIPLIDGNYFGALPTEAKFNSCSVRAGARASGCVRARDARHRM